jgi:hypothetical protein
VHRLQNITAPSVFNPRAFYDGKKNLFSAGPLKMNGDAAEVRILRFVGGVVVDYSRRFACVEHIVCRRYVRLTTTSREYPWSISRKADEGERHVNGGFFYVWALRLCESEADRLSNLVTSVVAPTKSSRVARTSAKSPSPSSRLSYARLRCCEQARALQITCTPR